MQILTQVPKFTKLNQTSPELKAIFWDMDGTLINTESFHALALENLFMQLGVQPQLTAAELDQLFCGKTDLDVYEFYLKNSKSSNSAMEQLPVEDFLSLKNQIFCHIIENIDSATFYSQEVHELLTKCKEAGYKLALITSSERLVTEYLIQKLSLANCFDLVLCREDTKENKPHPLPYLTALRHLGLQAHEVIIFEDSEAGLRAAESSQIPFFKASWYR